MAKKNKPEPVKDRAYFVEQINLRWNKARQSILQVGWLLIEARQILPPDEYTKLLQVDLCFHYSTLQKLKSLAESDRINDPKNRDLLPHSWNTLYEIIHLSEEAFQTGIERGIIRKDVTWKEVKALRDEFDPELQIKKAKRASARVYGSGKTTQRNLSGARSSGAVVSTQASEAQATPGNLGEEISDRGEDGRFNVEGAVPSTATPEPSAPPAEAPSTASVSIVNRIEAILSSDVPEDQQRALLDDLHRLKSKYPFIAVVHISVLEPDEQ